MQICLAKVIFARREGGSESCIYAVTTTEFKILLFIDQFFGDCIAVLHDPGIKFKPFVNKVYVTLIL